MNVLLFGPPGVGKSTLIHWLRANPGWTMGYDAIDLEDLYPSPVRYAIPAAVRDTIMGAADLDPKANYPGTYKVLLYLPQKAYEVRRDLRDLERPEKAKQAHQYIDEWYGPPGRYDLILLAEGKPSVVAKRLMRWLGSKRRHT